MLDHLVTSENKLKTYHKARFTRRKPYLEKGPKFDVQSRPPHLSLFFIHGPTFDDGARWQLRWFFRDGRVRVRPVPLLPPERLLELRVLVRDHVRVLLQAQVLPQEVLSACRVGRGIQSVPQRMLEMINS